MDMMTLSAITGGEVNAGWGPQAIENRLRAIATNAVREARVALNRDAGPWLDDDARRLNMIFDLLHLDGTPADMTMEALPMAAPQQVARNPALDAVEKALLKLQDVEEPAATPSKAVRK
jgi:hypothetical protein